jgi:hypothetical protein
MISWFRFNTFGFEISKEVGKLKRSGERVIYTFLISYNAGEDLPKHLLNARTQFRKKLGKNRSLL